MTPNRKLAVAVSSLVLAAAIFLAAILGAYLPYHSDRLFLAPGVVLGGIAVSLAAYVVVSRLSNRPAVRRVIFVLFFLAMAVPVFSVLIRRVTYARFGLTVYGLLPVPALDITVNQHGILWFREKTHLITRAEIESLLAPGVQVAIIGCGWDQVAKVEASAFALSDRVEIKVLSTSEAFATYNTLVAQGKNVVLIAHTTC
jgi:hypothetical protein